MVKYCIIKSKSLDGLDLYVAKGTGLDNCKGRWIFFRDNAKVFNNYQAAMKYIMESVSNNEKLFMNNNRKSGTLEIEDWYIPDPLYYAKREIDSKDWLNKLS